MKLTIKNKDFYKFTLPNTQAKDVVSSDVDSGFEGNFDKLSKIKTNEEMHAFYDSVIGQFMSEAGLTGSVTKNMSWVNALQKFYDIPTHNFKLDFEGKTFLLKHFVRIASDTSKLHTVIEEEKIEIESNENDILIFSKDTFYGFDQNLSDTTLITLTIVFSIKE